MLMFLGAKTTVQSLSN